MLSGSMKGFLLKIGLDKLEDIGCTCDLLYGVYCNMHEVIDKLRREILVTVADFPPELKTKILEVLAVRA